MNKFENMTLGQLRKNLVDAIVETRGKDYALGWLYSAYSLGGHGVDDDRDHLIAQIREYRESVSV
jgi:hypothetical protein